MTAPRKVERLEELTDGMPLLVFDAVHGWAIGEWDAALQLADVVTMQHQSVAIPCSVVCVLIDDGWVFVLPGSP